MPPEYRDLDEHFEAMLSEVNQYDDIYDQAIYIFLEMARKQFFMLSIKEWGDL